MGRHSTRIEADRFVKSYPSAQAAACALKRTKLARGAGVCTPDAWVSARGELSFALILGDCGLDLVPDLSAILEPLHQLARMPTDGFTTFDPFLRIRPRLHLAPPALRNRIDALMQLPSPAGTSLCHGDFHPGQVIRDPSRKSWLIDLDDMSLANPAADLGNLIAYLATSGLRSGPVAELVSVWTWDVLTAWGAAQPDHAQITYFTDISLIRRALKLAEKGDAAVLAQITPLPSAA